MIYLWWIGERAADDGMLERVRLHVAEEFEWPARRWDSLERPADTLDARRGQHSSRAVLQWLVDARPVAATRVLGVTDVDLFMPVLTFVFGEAQLDGVAAVVSSARLLDRSRATTSARLTKECVHELGHTFGLVHCTDAGCVMTRSASVRAVDDKRARLCPSCRARYRMFQQDGHHVYRADQDTHR